MSVRVLCLGNDLLADDALGIVVARRLRRRGVPGAEVTATMQSGFHLLDHLLGAERAIVVDTVQTGAAPPGTVFVLTEASAHAAPGGSPHYVGLFETLRLGRALELSVPRDVVIVAVEASDCITVGGEMHPAVERAIDEVIARVGKLLAGEAPAGGGEAAGAEGLACTS
jgi:hydrogenase maturation protease